MVPGEQPVIIATPKMTVQFEKNSAEQLANKSIEVGNAKVDLPTWCDMQPAPCDNSKTVMMQVMLSSFSFINIVLMIELICMLIIFSLSLLYLYYLLFKTIEHYALQKLSVTK